MSSAVTFKFAKLAFAPGRKRLLFENALPGLSFAQTKVVCSYESSEKRRRRRIPSAGLVKLMGAS
jgi:hypothetical protein